MLWAVHFNDGSSGYVEVGTGILYTAGGALITGPEEYSTTDTNPAQPGWYVPTPAPAPAPGPTSLKITAFAFKMRLTSAERQAIRTAAASNPALYDYMDIMDTAGYADLLDPVTIAGTQALESAGLIASGRASQLLSTTLMPGEAYDA